MGRGSERERGDGGKKNHWRKGRFLRLTSSVTLWLPYFILNMALKEQLFVFKRHLLLILFSHRRCSTCRRKKSLRTGSFFEELSRVSLGKILLCMYLWSVRELRTTVAQMLTLTKNTVGNIYALLRHYCGRDLQDRPVIPFGGRVYVVKCDESQFKHKSKVNQGFALSTYLNFPQSKPGFSVIPQII